MADKLEDLYDLYRDVLMSAKYYGRRLEMIKNRNWWLEVYLTVATSSTVGGWAIWQVGYGEGIWITVSAAAAVLGMVQPRLGYAASIERYTKLWRGLDDVFERMGRLVRQAKRTHSFSPRMEKALEAALDKAARLRELAEPFPIASLKELCYHEVNGEIPAERLWMPPPRPAAGNAEGNAT